MYDDIDLQQMEENNLELSHNENYKVTDKQSGT